MLLCRQTKSYLLDYLRRKQLYNQGVLQSVLHRLSVFEDLQLTGWLAVTRRLNEKQCGIPKRKGVDAVNGSELTAFILATTFFLARIMAKSMRLGGNWGMDDYTIMVAWARHPKQLDLLAAAVEIACTDLFFCLTHYRY